MKLLSIVSPAPTEVAHMEKNNTYRIHQVLPSPFLRLVQIPPIPTFGTYGISNLAQVVFHVFHVFNVAQKSSNARINKGLFSTVYRTL